jgi:putative oxidoreductase
MEIKTIIFWVLIAAYIIPGVIFGFKKLGGHPDSEAYFERWGYPLWFMHVLGFTEVACSILIVFSATRIYAIGIFATLVVGAFYTHVKHKDSKKDVMKPVFVGMLLAVIFSFTFWI